MKYQTKFLIALAFLLGIISGLNTFWAEWAALLAMIFAGIPHGSFDLRVAEAKWRQGVIRRSTVISLYLFSAIAMASLCFLTPSIGFIVFILISFYHFIDGEIGLDNLFWRASLFGSSAIILPMGLHFEMTRRYLSYFLEPTVIDMLAPWIQSLAIMYAVSLVGALLLDRNLWSLKIGDDWVQKLACLLSWFILPPLAGFCVWFIGRHSWEHITLCKTLLKDKQLSVPLDFLVISVVAICLFLPLSFLFDLTDLNQLFTASIILIAGLTLPHVLVIHNFRVTIQPAIEK